MGDEPRQILEHLRRLQSITDVLAWIANRFDKATDQVEHQQSIDDVLRELNEYLTSNFDRIDQMLLLILEKLPDEQASRRVKTETNRLRQETIKNRIQSLRVQIAKHQANLNWLQEQSAQYGANVTLEITNQIIWSQEKIRELNDEKSYLQQELDKIDAA